MKVRLEQDVDVAKILGVSSAGGRLLVMVTTDHRVSGTYPLKVIVEWNEKVILGLGKLLTHLWVMFCLMSSDDVDGADWDVILWAPSTCGN